MKLEGIRVVLTPRRHWEAMDLGLAILNRWRRATYGPWLAVCLPLIAVLFAALRNSPGWIPVCLWLLKPWIARIPLLVLSRAVFGPVPAISEVLTQAPKTLGKRPWLAFLSQRFSFRRALHMPVDLLEEPKGKQRVRRLRVLGRGTSGGAASTALLLFSHFEFCLYASFGLLCFFFGPESWTQDLKEYQEYGIPSLTLNWILALSYTVAVLILEPAFVAAGFGIYLARRTDLEGWDLELGFRGLAQRLEEADQQPATGQLRRGVIASGMLLGTLLALAPGTRACTQNGAVDPTAVAEEILASETFETVIIRKQWVPPEFGSNAIGQVLAPIVQLLAWVGLAAGVLMLIAWLAKQAKPALPSSSGKQPKPQPTSVFGLDLRAESLPPDPSATALRLWQQGQVRAALALLYRAALAQLVDRDALSIHASDTEQDCVERVSSLGQSSKALFFEQLTQAWLYSAYGARPPMLDEGSNLCRSWNEHFGGAS